MEFVMTNGEVQGLPPSRPRVDLLAEARARLIVKSKEELQLISRIIKIEQQQQQHAPVEKRIQPDRPMNGRPVL